jgi:hypothetical protein
MMIRQHLRRFRFNTRNRAATVRPRSLLRLGGLHREPSKRVLGLCDLGFKTFQMIGKPGNLVVLEVNLLLKHRLEGVKAAVR